MAHSSSGVSNEALAPSRPRTAWFFLMSAKWHDVKMVLRYSEGIVEPIVTPQWPMPTWDS
jgi:hypothetical protein